MRILLSLAAVLWLATPTALAEDPETEDPETEDSEELLVSEVEDEEVRSLRAIDGGLQFLLEEVEREQRFREGNEGIGQIAFETYALIVGGLSVDHPVIRENFAFLKENVPAVRWTYATCCYIFALDAAIAQLESDVLIAEPKASKMDVINHPSIGKKYRGELKSAVEHLLAAQRPTGDWSYTKQDSRLDNSNTQFALLALGVGAKRGVRIRSKVWKRSLEHFLGVQEKTGPVVEDRVGLYGDEPHRGGVDFVHRKKEGADDDGEEEDGESSERGRTAVAKKKITRPHLPIFGAEDIEIRARGWRYNEDGTRKYDWNMTCAGASSMLILRDQLKLGSAKKSTVDQSVWDGLGWLMKNWSVNQSYYGMYSLEKVADIAGIERFGNNDWYEQVSRLLLSRQQPDGGWPKGSGHGENRRVTTGFSLLILTRASALLTSNPASRMIVVTGGHEEEVQERRQNWAYLPERSTYVHVPSLVRTIRLRPNVRLMRILSSVVEAAEGDERADLVVPLAELESELTMKAARKMVGTALVDLVGSRLADLDAYRKWYLDYRRVAEMAEEREREDIPELLERHDRAKSSPLLLAHVIHALIRCEAKEAVPRFVDDLEHAHVAVRRAAYGGIRVLFQEDPPGFDPDAHIKERRRMILEIRAWVEGLTAEARS